MARSIVRPRRIDTLVQLAIERGLRRERMYVVDSRAVYNHGVHVLRSDLDVDTPDDTSLARMIARHNARLVRKGLRAEILTGAMLDANGGLSSTCKYVTIMELTGSPLPGWIQLDTPSSSAPAVTLSWHRGRYIARPKEHADCSCYGASGAYLWRSDKRLAWLVGHGYPIELHDRPIPRTRCPYVSGIS